HNYRYEFLGKPKKNTVINNMAIGFMEQYRKHLRKCLASSKHFDPPAKISELGEYAKPFVSLGNQTGEGWFLTGEMIELIHSGASNIVCAQPFGCLPNHVVGKGVIKELKLAFPDANIVAVDYDPGASEVNQLNRIKLMLSTAQKNLEQNG
ncbi:MAG: 2-hydroxyglutaryl-CoA dehydratase, partial [Lachnospiraceae bacterium]|nr:2-hydroxyglutaryl-CoA dehydratase [Lachnospiraceae bacterium]